MMPPQILVLSGPNGAGKSTAAARLLPDSIPFVNAGEVAKILPNYPSQSTDIEAARTVLRRMDELERERSSFALETTLASRSLAARIRRLRQSGYRFRLFFLWTPSAEFSVQRVAARVRAGGHHIPKEAIRRRYNAGLSNFFAIYQPLADKWTILNNTAIIPTFVAEDIMDKIVRVEDRPIWDRMRGDRFDES